MDAKQIEGMNEWMKYYAMKYYTQSACKASCSVNLKTVWEKAWLFIHGEG
jgi:hypothetical protein